MAQELSEVVARRCSVKKLFLKISQNSQENTCARVSFLIKLGLQLYIKRDSGAGVFLWILRNLEHLFSESNSSSFLWVFHNIFFFFFFCIIPQRTDDSIKIHQISESILVEILYDFFTLTSSFPSDWIKSSSQLNFSFQRKWSKNMWSCAKGDTVHAQRLVARLTFAEWRSACNHSF